LEPEFIAALSFTCCLSRQTCGIAPFNNFIACEQTIPILKYPGVVDKIITLDNSRMPLPGTKHPKVFSLRSSDRPADEGVMPTAWEQKSME